MKPSKTSQTAAKSQPARAQKLAAALKRNMARRKAGNLPPEPHARGTTIPSAAKKTYGSGYE